MSELLFCSCSLLVHCSVSADRSWALYRSTAAARLPALYTTSAAGWQCLSFVVSVLSFRRCGTRLAANCIGKMIRYARSRMGLCVATEECGEFGQKPWQNSEKVTSHAREFRFDFKRYYCHRHNTLLYNCCMSQCIRKRPGSCKNTK